MTRWAGARPFAATTVRQMPTGIPTGRTGGAGQRRGGGSPYSEGGGSHCRLSLCTVRRYTIWRDRTPIRSSPMFCAMCRNWVRCYRPCGRPRLPAGWRVRASGSGRKDLHLTIRGLIGLSAGVRSGFEVHFLGLAAGLDLARPASRFRLWPDRRIGTSKIKRVALRATLHEHWSETNRFTASVPART